MATAGVDTREFLSQTKFYDSYSRFKDDTQTYETWDEAVDRVIAMHEGYYKDKGNQITSYLQEAKQAYKEQTDGIWTSQVTSRT